MERKDKLTEKQKEGKSQEKSRRKFAEAFVKARMESVRIIIYCERLSWTLILINELITRIFIHKLTLWSSS